MKVKKSEIVFLKINCWEGVSVGAEHWYGVLRSYDERHNRIDTELQRKMTAQDVVHLNKKRGMGHDCGYKVGEFTTCFYTRRSVIEKAKRVFRRHFPRAKVLMLGDAGTAQQQPVIVGPKDFKEPINKLVKEAEKINWWDNEEEMQILWDKWQKIWPLKYNVFSQKNKK